MAFEIAKAGWMHRESSILRIWKHNWFVLNTDGTLRYFDSQDSHEAEDAITMPTQCVCVKGGPHVRDVPRPANRPANTLLELTLNNNNTWLVCAESEDDAKAWYIALEDARMIGQGPPPALHGAPPPVHGAPLVHHGAPPVHHGAPPVHHGTSVTYSSSVYPQQTVAYTYPGQYMYGSNPPPVVVQQTPAPGQPNTSGHTTVIIDDRRRRYYDDGGGAFLMGAAMGSMMWYPFLWW